MKVKKERNVQVNVSLSVRVTGGASDNFYAFAIAKNGSIVSRN